MRRTAVSALVAAVAPAIAVPLSFAVARLHPFASDANDFARGLIVGAGIGVALFALYWGRKDARAA